MGRTTALACTLQLAGDVTGLELLDLACGQGLATRALAGAGARPVTGVDSAAPMLRIARGYESREPLGVRYVEDDAQRLGAFQDASFDGVTCQLGLMDIPDLNATLAAVHRVVRDEGWFAFGDRPPRLPGAARRDCAGRGRTARSADH